MINHKLKKIPMFVFVIVSRIVRWREDKKWVTLFPANAMARSSSRSSNFASSLIAQFSCSFSFVATATVVFSVDIVIVFIDFLHYTVKKIKWTLYVTYTMLILVIIQKNLRRNVKVWAFSCLFHLKMRALAKMRGKTNESFSFGY